jgi:hypothetical protein
MGAIMKLCGGKVAVETTKTKHSKFYYSQSSSNNNNSKIILVASYAI